MNETRGNSRTKPMRGGLKGGEINSLKDSEKTIEYRYCLNCKYSIQTPYGILCLKTLNKISQIELCFITNCMEYNKK